MACSSGARATDEAEHQEPELNLPAELARRADVLTSRYENRLTIITSNRPVEDWTKLMGDVVIVTPLLDRLMHHAHLLKFDGKRWLLREAAARVAKRADSV
jgi:hypothetical protein